MGEVKKSSNLGYSSSPYTVATANKVGGVNCFAREIGGKDPPPLIVRCRRSREKNCEECPESAAVRVSSDSHQLIYPFAAVGIDYFGPLYVHAGPLTRSMKKNPKLHKRYALFGRFSML